MLTRPSGFSLFELIIALAIIAVLAGIALPSYQNQLQQARRSDATTALLIFAERMERHFLENGSYSSATTAIYQETSDEGHYQLSVTTESDSYQLTATPTGVQADDSECANYSLNQLGERTISGTGTIDSCW